jgi:hypothetical protein
MTKVMRILDVEALIDAVRDRPALWDTRCSEYSDKVNKAQCWREIFCNVEEGYDDLDAEKQKEIGKILLQFVYWFTVCVHAIFNFTFRYLTQDTSKHNVNIKNNITIFCYMRRST